MFLRHLPLVYATMVTNILKKLKVKNKNTLEHNSAMVQMGLSLRDRFISEIT